MPTALRRALLAGVITTLALAAPASAMYLTEDPGNVDVAEAHDGSGGYVVLSRDNMGGMVILRAGASTFEPAVCEDGSEGGIETDFMATGTPESFGFGRQQSWARASGVIPGRYREWNYCTGESIDLEVTRSVTLNLTGSKYTTTTSSRGTVKDPDGTVRVSTHKVTSAIATGTFTIGDVVAVVENGSITHEELAVRVR